MGSKVKSVKKGKTQITDLKTHMKSYASKIDVVSDELKKMMKGNGTDAYWQGANAYDWYTMAYTYLNKIVGNYKNSYNEFADYATLYARAKAKSNEKIKKSTLKLIDGTTFTTGVKKNVDSKKITSIPATVNKDASNDDQNTSSYATFRKMKDALNSLVSITNKLSNDWKNVAANTTGKMHSDAANRQKYMNNRKGEISRTLRELDENYIGDMLFSRK